jgi:hypothetical protein
MLSARYSAMARRAGIEKLVREALRNVYERPFTEPVRVVDQPKPRRKPLMRRLWGKSWSSGRSRLR